MERVQFHIEITDDFDTALRKMRKYYDDVKKEGKLSQENYDKLMASSYKDTQILHEHMTAEKMKTEREVAKKSMSFIQDKDREEKKKASLVERASKKQAAIDKTHHKEYLIAAKEREKMMEILTWGLSKKLQPKAFAIGMWTALGENVLGFVGNLAKAIIETIDFNHRLSATFKLFGRTASEAKTASSEVRAFSSATGVSMEEASDWRLKMEEMNLPREMQKLTMDAMADIQAMGGSAGSMMELLSSMRKKQLQGTMTPGGVGAVSAMEIVPYLASAGLDQTRLERYLGIDSKRRDVANAALMKTYVKLEEMPKLLAGAVYDKTGQALGSFAEQTTGSGLMGNLNKLKTGFFEALEKVDWEPLIGLMKNTVSVVLNKDKIEAFAKSIEDLGAGIYRLLTFLGVIEGKRDERSATVKQKEVIEQLKEGEEKTRKKSASEMMAAEFGAPVVDIREVGKIVAVQVNDTLSKTGDSYGVLNAKPNWKGGEVTGISNGMATVKAAPGEGLVSIGKGEFIVPKDGQGGGGKPIIVNFNAPISCGSGTSQVEITEMFEAALTKAFQTMEVQA